MLGALLVGPFVALGAPSVALPSLGRDLAVPFSATAWVLTAWALLSAVTMPLVGRLTGRFGLRWCLVVGALLVAAGSVLAAVAPSLGILVLGRLLGGAGAGALVVTSYAVVDARFDQRGRTRALAGIAAVAATASGCGTLLGGVLTQLVGWRWVLAAPAVALLAAVPAAHLAPSARSGPRALDLLGAIPLALLGGGVVTLLQAHSTAMPTAVVAIVAGATLVGAAGTVARLRRHPDGFVPRAVIAAPGFLAAGVIGLAVFGAYYATLFIAPALLEQTKGWGRSPPAPPWSPPPCARC